MPDTRSFRRSPRWAGLACLALPATVAAHGGCYGRWPGADAAPPPAPLCWQSWWSAHRHHYPAAGDRRPRLSAEEFTRHARAPLLAIAAGTSDPELLAECLFALARGSRGSADDAVLARLTAALRHPATRVRQAALLGLGILADPRGLRLLDHAARNTLLGRGWLARPGQPIDPDLRHHALLGMGLLAHHRGSPLPIRQAIHRALAAILSDPQQAGQPDPTATAAIRALAMLRVQVAGSPAELGLTRAVLRTLNRCWDGRQPGLQPATRARAAIAVGRLLGRGTSGFHRYYALRLQAILAATDHPAPHRIAAAIGLGALATGDDPAVTAALLAEARSAHHTRLRGAAILALGEIGGPANLAALCELLTAPQRAVREYAALALGRLGQRLPAQRQRVAAALQDRAGLDRPACAALATGLAMVGGTAGRRGLRHILSGQSSALSQSTRSELGPLAAEPTAIDAAERSDRVDALAADLREPHQPTPDRITAVRRLAAHLSAADLPVELVPHRDLRGVPSATRLRFPVATLLPGRGPVTPGLPCTPGPATGPARPGPPRRGPGSLGPRPPAVPLPPRLSGR